MIQKIFEAAVNGEITEFTELLTKELNARIHAAIDERVSDTIDATYNVCEECDWDDEEIEDEYFDENEDDIYEDDEELEGLDLSEMNYLGKDKKFGREFYEKDGQLHVKKPGGTYVQNLGSVSVPSNKRMMKGLVKDSNESVELEEGPAHQNPRITAFGGMQAAQNTPSYKRYQDRLKKEREERAKKAAAATQQGLQMKKQKRESVELDLDESIVGRWRRKSREGFTFKNKNKPNPTDKAPEPKSKELPKSMRNEASLTPSQERDAQRRLKPTRATVAKVKLPATDDEVAANVKKWQSDKGGNPGNTKKRRLRDLRLKKEEVELEEAKKKKKAKKDYDGDGKIETSTAEWQGSRDKAIKAAIAARGGN